MSTNLIGRRLGAYVITGELGHGGMANVYRAEQPSIGREVAIKVLPAHFLQDPTFVKRFTREVQVIAKLQHPHILPVYDFGEEEGMPYIVMAYMTGGTLSEYLLQHPGGMPLEEVSRLVDQIADGLDHAHRKGVIHRDFKPGNVLLDENRNVFLADFGIAKVAESASQITGSGIIGTPAYMAPETPQAAEVTSLVDIYALGVTLFEMLVGRHPYPTETPVGMLMAHASQPIPDIAAQRPDLPQGIQNIVDRAMAKEPSQRYQTAAAMAADLRAVLHGDAPSTEEMPRPAAATVAVTVRLPPTRPLERKTPRPTMPVILGGVAVAALAVALILLSGQGMFAGTSGPTPTPTPEKPFKVLSGHKDAVSGLAFSPDSRLLATGSLDRKVIVWDAGAGTKQLTLDLPDQVYSLGFYPDGHAVTVGGVAGSLSVWDAKTGDQLGHQEFLPAGQVSLAVSPDGAQYAVASRDSSVAYFDAASFKQLGANNYPGAVWSAVFSPDGKTLAAGMDDGSVILRAPQTDQDAAKLPGKGGGAKSLTYSPDGKWLAAIAGNGKTLVIWDVAGGKIALSLSAGGGSVTSLAWSPDGKSLYTAADDGVIQRWDIATGKSSRTIHAGEVASLAVSPDGSLLASGMADGAVDEWKTE